MPPTFSTNSPFNSAKRYDESANKLNTIGVYPQATRGQQCVCVAPTQFLALSMLPASATGVTFKSQRCLSSRIAVCYGKCTHPWQSTLKYLAVMWTKSITFYFQKSPPEFALAWNPARQSVCVGPSPSPLGIFGNIKSSNGIVSCDLFGGFGAQRSKKLAVQFEPHSVAGQKPAHRMHAGHTPAPNMRWPRHPKLGPRQPILQLILPSEQPFASHVMIPFMCFHKMRTISPSSS